jgi:hypothetical protein
MPVTCPKVEKEEWQVTPLNVLVTVDTEWWPPTAHWTGANWQEHLRRDIYGVTAQGEYGLTYQLDVLDAHSLKAVFHVESLFACAIGIEPLAEIVQQIQNRGHEVQLQIHSEWLRWMPDPIVPSRTGNDLKDYTEDEQFLLLARGLENLRQAGAVDVCAFRAGNYGADFATLRALARNGILFDTSYNACYLDASCGLRLPDPLFQPTVIEGICEVPITFFEDFPGHYRHVQLSACSYREIRQALLHSLKWHRKTLVLVSHSFELIRRDSSPLVPDRIAVRRFSRLCRFLAANRDRFRTVGFLDLDPDSITRFMPTRELRSNILWTAIRCAEQLARRLKS